MQIVALICEWRLIYWNEALNKDRDFTLKSSWADKGMYYTLLFTSGTVRMLNWQHNSNYTNIRKRLYTDVSDTSVGGSKFCCYDPPGHQSLFFELLNLYGSV